MKREEDAIHAGIIDLLKLAVAPGVLFYHIPNAAKRSLSQGALFKRLGVVAGMPDIALVLANGHAAYIEVKTPKGVLSPEQKAFKSLCENYSIPYAIARSITDAQEILEAWGAIRTRRPGGALRRAGAAEGASVAAPITHQRF